MRRASAAPRSRPGSRPSSHHNPRRSNKSVRGRLQIRTGHAGKPTQEIVEKQRSEAQRFEAVRDFENGVRYLQKQKYDRAKEIFEKLASGPAREVAARARVHLLFCEQKLRAHLGPSAPKRAEDNYNLGVVALNACNLGLAIEYLSKAAKLGPNREYIQYALAAALALQGNADAALEHLRESIALRPANRYQARHGEEFQSLAADPRFTQLVSA